LFDAFSLPLDSIIASDAAIKATGDMKAAIRWFRENAAGANEFGIDTNLIYAGGVSAGAIAALHVAYLDEGNIVENTVFDSIITVNGGIHGSSSSNLSYSDHVKGVLSFSGALKDARWIDPGEPVVYSAHDEFDQTVPYGRDVSTAFGAPVEIWGSFEVDKAAREAGIRSQLTTIKGSTGHVSYFLIANTPNYDLVVESATSFLEYDICDRAAGVQPDELGFNMSVYPNPSNGMVYLQGERLPNRIDILDQTGRRVRTYRGQALNRIDLGGLAAGSYRIIMYDARASFSTVPLIKR
jgi:hypothetical protein